MRAVVIQGASGSGKSQRALCESECGNTCVVTNNRMEGLKRQVQCGPNKTDLVIFEEFDLAKADDKPSFSLAQAFTDCSQDSTIHARYTDAMLPKGMRRIFLTNLTWREIFGCISEEDDPEHKRKPASGYMTKAHITAIRRRLNVYDTCNYEKLFADADDKKSVTPPADVSAPDVSIVVEEASQAASANLSSIGGPAMPLNNKRGRSPGSTPAVVKLPTVHSLTPQAGAAPATPIQPIALQLGGESPTNMMQQMRQLATQLVEQKKVIEDLRFKLDQAQHCLAAHNQQAAQRTDQVRKLEKTAKENYRSATSQAQASVEKLRALKRVQDPPADSIEKNMKLSTTAKNKATAFEKRLKKVQEERRLMIASLEDEKTNIEERVDLLVAQITETELHVVSLEHGKADLKKELSKHIQALCA